VIFPMTLTDP